MIVTGVRDDFPLLVNQPDLVYLDSAATTLKPEPVIRAVTEFYTGYTANVHRSVHRLSEEATAHYEQARESLALLLNVDPREIALVRNATEGFNLVANTRGPMGPTLLSPGEHHSNLLPWRRYDYAYLPVDGSGLLDVDASVAMILDRKPRNLAISLVSNALGIENPVATLSDAARQVGAAIILDASQAVGHYPLDLMATDCDYACFSAHKMLGPSGVGVLFQSETSPTPIAPGNLGGEMVHEAHIEDFEARPFPWGLEAGTPNIEGVIGAGAAAEYLLDQDLNAVRDHCNGLSQQLLDGLAALPGYEAVTPFAHTSIVAFRAIDRNAHMVSRILSNRSNIMVRSGFHCAQPLHELLDSRETLRASFHLYNEAGDVDQLLGTLATISGNPAG